MQESTRIAMPLAAGYDFTISQADLQAGGEIRITLTQQVTDRSIVFRQRYGCVENMTRHMRSLTDTQCADWLKGKPKQPKEKESR